MHLAVHENMRRLQSVHSQFIVQQSAETRPHQALAFGLASSGGTVVSKPRTGVLTFHRTLWTCRFAICPGSQFFSVDEDIRHMSRDEKAAACKDPWPA